MRSFISSGTPGPWSMTSSSTVSCDWRARSTGGRAGGECRSALENRFASTRSSSPGSARSSGSPSGTAISSLDDASSPRSATGATSSIAVGRRNGCSEPVCSRLMSSRLPMSASSRSALWSMVASSAAVSASLHCTSVCRRLLALALIEASGVRRSWLTAASSAVRIRFPSASASAWAACVRSRSRSSAAAAWAANPTTRPGVAAGECSATTRARSWRTSTRTAPSIASTVPLDATGTQRPETRSCSSARPPSVLVRCARTAAGVSAPPSTVCASASRDAASSLLCAACSARRAARCTTLLTATATVTNSTRASRLRGSPIVNVCSGGVKYQFSSRLDATAVSTAGQNPPTTAVVTTATR